MRHPTCDYKPVITFQSEGKSETEILTVVMAATAAFSLVSLTAQEKKMDAKKAGKGGILHPEMAVENGTYDKPMAMIGTRPDQPWSTTSVAAGVDSKPQPGHAVMVVGEIVDFSCYLQLGKHGEKHRTCGQKCINNGQPIGLLAKDGTLYMLMPEEHDPRRDGGVDGKASAAAHMVISCRSAAPKLQ